MSKDNFLLVLKTFLKRTPFRPFTLELISGSRLEVNHPEALTLYEELVVCTSTSMARNVFEYGHVVQFIDNTGTG